MANIDRRTAIGVGVAAGAAGLDMPALAQGTPKAAFTPKDLPFDPKGVPGLSEKLLVSHHDNNYVGAVKRLGAITAEFAALDPAKAPVSPSMV